MSQRIPGVPFRASPFVRQEERMPSPSSSSTRLPPITVEEAKQPEWCELLLAAKRAHLAGREHEALDLYKRGLTCANQQLKSDRTELVQFLRLHLWTRQHLL